MVTLKEINDYMVDKEELSYKLSEAVFEGYSGQNFYTSGVLDDKNITLKKIKKIIKETKNLGFYKGNQEYWYPIKNMDVSFYENHPRYYFYIVNDKKNSLSNFKAINPTKDEKFMFYYSMIDSLKMIFNLMVRDISTNDCQAEVTQKVLSANNEIFMLLKDIVGDVKDYAGRNTYEHYIHYLNEIDEKHEESLKAFSVIDFLDRLKRKHSLFKEDSVHLEEMITQAKILMLDSLIENTDKKQRIKV